MGRENEVSAMRAGYKPSPAEASKGGLDVGVSGPFTIPHLRKGLVDGGELGGT
jgi:hypothetical protein